MLYLGLGIFSTGSKNAVILEEIESMLVASSVAELKALNPGSASAVFLSSGRKSGIFEVLAIASLLAAEQARITLDALEGIYISSTQNASLVYRRVLDGTICPEWFGADPAQGDNSAPAINLAIQMAIQMYLDGVGACEVYLSGRYKIDSPVEVFRRDGSGWAYVSVNIAQSSCGYSRVGLYPTYVDRPAVIIQSLRSSNFERVNCISPSIPSFPGYAEFIEETTPWWNDGSKRDEQYTPYCAVAIDPFGDEVPPEGEYPGYEDFYTSTSGSSILTFRNCEAFGFILGFGVSLGPNVQLGDSIAFEHCTTYLCKTGYAVCQAQNRGITISGAHSLFCRTFVECDEYGAGIGPLPHINGGVLAGAHRYVLNCNSQGYSPGIVEKLYAESIFSIGYWGSVNGGAGHSLNFVGCEFKFVPGDTCAILGHVLHNTAQVNFIGGALMVYTNDNRNICLFNLGLVAFDGVTLNAPPYAVDWGNLSFKNCPMRTGGGVITDVARVESLVRETFLTSMGKMHIRTDQIEIERRPETLHGYISVDLDGSVLVTVSGTTATFTSITPGLYAVGDYISTYTAWSLTGASYGDLTNALRAPIGRVSSISGAVITLDAVPVTFTTGIYSLLLVRMPSVHARARGTMANGSNQITSVTSGHSFFAGTPPAAICRIRGTGIPEGAWITDIAGSTITLSVNATASGTVDLYDAHAIFSKAIAAAPSTGVWFNGDFAENSAAYVNDGSNMLLDGWVCAASGSPGTWVPAYRSTVSPSP